MFNNSVVFTITNKDSFMMINYELSWEIREQFYILLQEYIPSRVRKIIPTDNEYRYDISWNSTEDFDQFISDTRYLKSLTELKRFSMYVDWE